MEMKNLSIDLQELSLYEAEEINGGESLWYWIAYGLGSVAGFVADNAGTIRPSEYR